MLCSWEETLDSRNVESISYVYSLLELSLSVHALFSFCTLLLHVVIDGASVVTGKCLIIILYYLVLSIENDLQQRKVVIRVHELNIQINFPVRYISDS